MPYSNNDDLDKLFGSQNVEKWADINNDDNATTISTRKAQAIAVSDAEIDDVARTCPNTIPLADAAAAVPVSVQHWSTVGAGLWLYEGRGAQDFDQESGRPNHRYAWLKAERRRFLEDVRTGRKKLSAL